MQGLHSTLCHSQQLKNKAKIKPQIQSINRLYNDQNGSTCNYCHKGTKYSWALVSQNYQTYTYQTMMQRGWRRCGTYYYKIDLQKSCCKQWTHRLDVNQFKIKKDQKKTIKKMMTFAYQPVVQIINEKNPKNYHQKQQKTNNNSNPSSKQQLKLNKKQQSTKIIIQLCNQTQQMIKQLCLKLNHEIFEKLNELIPKQKLNLQKINQKWNLQFLDKLRSFNAKPQQKNDYYCNWGMLIYGCNKSKFISPKQYPLVQFIKKIKFFVQTCKFDDFVLTLQRGGYLLIQVSQKLKEQKQQNFQVIKQVKKQNHNGNHNNQNKNTITKNPQLKSETKKTENKMEVQKQNKVIFQDNTSKSTKKSQKSKIQQQPKQMENPQIKKKASSSQFQKLQPQYQGQLIITTDKITFGRLTIQLVQAQQNRQSFQMYTRYCKQIHQKQQKGFSSYIDFLCKRSLTFSKEQKIAQGDKQYLPSFDPSQSHQKKIKIKDKITKRLGCYHMKYYLDKKFIAIGVIDLLPNGLSSVYFFYEPQFKDKRLGVFSSIIEIEYIRYLSLTFPQFKYYYMGFYIHDNEKMSYKGDYGPYQLLCPITYNFVTVDDRVKEIVNKITRQGYKNIRLAPQGIQKDPDMVFSTDLGVYIDKNIKLMYRKKSLKLKQISPQFFIPVLQLLKTYLNVWGKQLFDIFTFTF